MRGSLLAQEAAEGGTGGRFTGILGLAGKGSADEFEVLAEVGRRLFLNRIRSAFPALVGGRFVEVLAVKTNPKVCAALIAAIGTTGLTRGCPIESAGVAMSGHEKWSDQPPSKKQERGSTFRSIPFGDETTRRTHPGAQICDRAN